METKRSLAGGSMGTMKDWLFYIPGRKKAKQGKVYTYIVYKRSNGGWKLSL